MARRPVSRKRDGTFVIRLDDETAALLSSLADQLDPLLDDPSADAGLRRLFPPAHPDDLLAEAAWQIEQGAALRESRRLALAALRQPVGKPIAADELVRWMQGVNSLRLVLAERLGVAADGDAEEAMIDDALERIESDDPDDVEAARRVLGAGQLYRLLAWMVDGAVWALGDPTRRR